MTNKSDVLRSDRSSLAWSVVSATSGNFLAAFDFFIFGYYATAIGRAFFPAESEYASLMLSLATFGVGFLIRPLGAIIVGGYIDRHGRRKGLLLTLGLMAIATLVMAFVPGYQTIGLAAPLIVVLARLTQGFSEGGELPGVAVYLAEIAKSGRKGFFVSLQPASQQVAVIILSLVGMALSELLRPEQMDSWGWRIPFLFGSTLIPFLFVIRRTLPETEEFLSRVHHPTPSEILYSLLANWRLIVLGILTVMMTTVSFYYITAYTPTFGRQVLKLAPTDNLMVTMCVGFSNLLWQLVSGILSDRIGRRPILIACTVLALLTAYPALAWLIAAPSFFRLLAVELWLSLLYAWYNGTMAVWMTEIMPAHVRVTSFSFAYNIAVALFGGFTPAISTFLIHETGNAAIGGVWLSIAAACSLAAALLIKLPVEMAVAVRPAT
jgi:MFS family permease